MDIEGTNHYSVPNRRASQAFNDPDDILSDAQSQDTISHCVDVSSSGRYLNTPLSCSYDERFSKSGGFSLSAKDSNYDGTSISSHGGGNFSCSDSSYRLQCDPVRSDKFFSENSLHRSRSGSLHRKLTQMHISEPDLNHDDVDVVDGVRHVYSVPTIRNAPVGSSSSAHDFNTGLSSQTINQVVDLVQASVLLQDCKRAVSSGSLEMSAPKPKTKEWIETSLDSPVVTKKRKNKVLSEACVVAEPTLPAQWLENGLPSGPDPFYNHQHQQTYYEEHDFVQSSCDLRKSPSPLLAQGGLAEYRNSSARALYSPKVPYERPASSNSQVLYANGNQYHHYENIEELSTASPTHSVVNKSISYYENLPGPLEYSSSSYKLVSDNLESGVLHLNLEDNRPVAGLSVAQPQEPPKRPTRRILADCFVTENVTDIAGRDFQDTLSNDTYEPVTYRENPHRKTHTPLHCDTSYQYSHSSYHPESLPPPELEKTSIATPGGNQNWQNFARAEQNQSPVPSQQNNMNFSPNVEVNVVSFGHFQPYWEETKPYEISDFYKYSTKHRRQSKQASNMNESQDAEDMNDPSQLQFHSPGQERGPPNNAAQQSDNAGHQLNQHQELSTSVSSYDKNFLDNSIHL